MHFWHIQYHTWLTSTCLSRLHSPFLCLIETDEAPPPVHSLTRKSSVVQKRRINFLFILVLCCICSSQKSSVRGDDKNPQNEFSAGNNLWISYAYRNTNLPCPYVWLNQFKPMCIAGGLSKEY